ncbi:protein of unknown function [Evansella caseinilytica]|uniref:DUF1798 family protein n=1 Tax=Evansella caseinilytica TaxID=1503961 RepID=A0A1H3NIK5_9BACI|nr:YppE family protein [Evansella caseinilytica]SDY88756.1 protein of unknown function [Evansella caseinilytica]
MLSDDNRQLKEVTGALLQKNEEAFHYFEKYCVDEMTADFHKDVKPFADEVKRLADLWMLKTELFIREQRPKYLHRSQLEDAYENLQAQSVACFQKDTKRKAFIERNKSIKYTLEILLAALEKPLE